jgi:DNA modification methylase
MKDDSWLIFWYAPEPWAEPIYQLINQNGFKTRRLPGVWTKGHGQLMHPDRYLARTYENFYYARRGDAKINMDKRGRADIFNFPPPATKQKIHPTERPIALMEELLKVFVWEGSRILVPFAGSGNTLRAAFNLNMFPLGYDLSKEYKDAFTYQVLNEEKNNL